MTEARWNIQLHGNDLLWQPTEETPIWRNYRLDEAEPFFSFKELGESFSEENVLRFAKMWGPLGICRCPPGRFLTHGAEYGWGLEGKPVFHPDAPEGQRIKFKNKLDFWIKSPVRCSWRRIELGGKTWFAESLIAWKNLSHAVAAVIQLACPLFFPGVVSARTELPQEPIEFLEELCLYGFTMEGKKYWPLIDEPPNKVTAREALILLNNLVNDWLSDARARPYCHFGIERETAKIKYDQVIYDRSGAFPVIATELAVTLADAKMKMCANCKRPFLLVRERKSRQVFCPDCGTRAAQKFAQRNRRSKQSRSNTNSTDKP